MSQIDPSFVASDGVSARASTGLSAAFSSFLVAVVGLGAFETPTPGPYRVGGLGGGGGLPFMLWPQPPQPQRLPPEITDLEVRVVLAPPPLGVAVLALHSPAVTGLATKPVPTPPVLRIQKKV